MAFKRWGCEFDGPWPNTDILKPCPGIWVIWKKEGKQWDVLEVGQSINIRASVVTREPELARQAGSVDALHYSACYTADLSEEGREGLAAHVRKIACPDVEA